ncbi:MAG: response regulator transcription factor [Burkholderiales bacterium]
MIRLLLADDHQLVREGLKQILGQSADIEIAAEAATGDEALAQAKAREFDMAVLDLSMPGLSGIALIKRLKLEKPKLRMLVLSMHAENQYAARALRAGALGYLTKDCASEQLIVAIRKIAQGGVYLSDSATQVLLAATVRGDTPPHTRLSDREFLRFSFCRLDAPSNTTVRQAADDLFVIQCIRFPAPPHFSPWGHFLPHTLNLPILGNKPSSSKG